LVRIAEGSVPLAGFFTHYFLQRRLRSLIIYLASKDALAVENIVDG
jgi:hypothetical protein